MSTKLYVGNLDYGVTNEELNELFSQFGKVVSAEVISDRYSGRSKGFAFVQMEDEAGAEKAIKEANEQDFKGRKMIVNEARPREDRGFEGRAA